MVKGNEPKYEWLTMTRGKLIILLSTFAILSLFSMLSVYFTHQLPTEETKTITLFTYKHMGTYDYTAKLRSNIIYNQSELKPGQGTLYTEITEYINTSFSYTFESTQEANITIEYRIDLVFPKWNKTLNILPQTKLNSIGNVSRFSNNYLVNIASVQELKRTLEEETRAYVSDYNVTIRPEIHTIANNNMTTIDEYFTPTMTMTFNYGTPEGSYISTTGLEHTRPNAITDTNTIPILGVMNQRYASYVFCLATLSPLVVTIWAYTKTLKPSLKPIKSIEEIIAPYEEIVVEAAGEPLSGRTVIFETGVGNRYFKERKPTITVKTLEDLVKVADLLGKPVVFYEKTPSPKSKESTYIFYVIDGTTRYECTITAPTTTEEEEEAEGD